MHDIAVIDACFVNFQPFSAAPHRIVPFVLQYASVAFFIPTESIPTSACTISNILPSVIAATAAAGLAKSSPSSFSFSGTVTGALADSTLFGQNPVCLLPFFLIANVLVFRMPLTIPPGALQWFQGLFGFKAHNGTAFVLFLGHSHSSSHTTILICT